jgi:hypothetical protein
VLSVAFIPLWVLGGALVLVIVPLVGTVRHNAARPSAGARSSALLRGTMESGRGPRVLVREARDTLLGLLTEDGRVTPTFERMVAWYREVSDEMDCRDAFEMMLLALDVPAVPAAAAGTVE